MAEIFPKDANCSESFRQILVGYCVLTLRKLSSVVFNHSFINNIYKYILSLHFLFFYFYIILEYFWKRRKAFAFICYFLISFDHFSPLAD